MIASTKLNDKWFILISATGGVCYSKHLNTRLVAAAWCLASCVLLYAYSCILTSFISAPNTQVLVKSINEIPENKNLRPVVIKKTGADLIVSVRTESFGKDFEWI